MRESTTYQAILQEGRDEGIAKGRAEGVETAARETLLRMGHGASATRRSRSSTLWLQYTMSSIWSRSPSGFWKWKTGKNCFVRKRQHKATFVTLITDFRSLPMVHWATETR